ncbi:non-ribosomal peptide synthetase [Sinorhizobium meliloti]|uniref:non-ribosomal peptide synthetase n=1 Tax=Rhizobium meliloti TaxID=382 RepID=UPI0013E4087B|nr:non-ribosomal peptide synthetase [Sinorhizobium meliloti]
MSYAQERIWFAEQAQVGAAALHLRATVSLEGPLDIAALSGAVRDLTARHDILRSRFFLGPDGPVQEVLEPHQDVVRFVDLSEEHDDARLVRLMSDEAPLDLAAGEVLRVLAVRLTSMRHVVLIGLHHIASDEASWNILLDELQRFYRARREGVAPELPPLPMQFADYAAWERSAVAAGAFDAQRAFWARTLSGLGPADAGPRYTTRTTPCSLATQRRTLDIGAPTLERLDAFARRAGATRFMVLLSALFVVLATASGQRDLIVGTFASTRRLGTSDRLIGPLLNVVGIRARFGDDPTLSEIVACVREVVIEALEHGTYPFELLVDELGLPRPIGRHPVFRTLFVQREAGPASSFAGIDMRAEELEPDAALPDLTFSTLVRGDVLSCVAQFRRDAMSAEHVDDLLTDYARTLDALADSPRTRLRGLHLRLGAPGKALDGDRASVPRGGFHELILAEALRHPDRIAVQSEDGSQTYGELAAQSARVAAALIKRGLVAEDKVAVALDPGPGLVAVLLGIARAGLTYVPLDPRQPVCRRDDRLRLAGAKLLVAADSPPIGEGAALVPIPPAHLLAELGERAASDPPVHGTQAAYIIYTSGSTGEPKGVVVTHAAVSNVLLSMQAELALTASDRVMGTTPIGFDIAALELFLPLLAGARLVVASPRMRTDPDLLARHLDVMGITLAQGTPSFWSMLLAAGWPGRSEMTVLCGGEALPAKLAHALIPRAKAVWNLYGPTETTIWSSAALLKATLERVPIGRPIANTRICVLDESMRELPAGVVGELCICGIGLARGYHGRTDLTAARFLPDPRGYGERLYRTGDRAVVHEDGSIVLLGRDDSQVKIRGHRVELGELEAILQRHPAIERAVVVAVEDDDGMHRLVAHVVATADASDIRDFLSDRVPAEIVPSVRVWAKLPISPHGKVDRAALAASVAATSERSYEPPRGAFERAIAAIWSSILEVDSIGRGDNFFHLGGHSLSGVRMLARAGKMLEKSVPLRLLFENPDLERFAAALSREEPGREGARPRPLRARRINRHRMALAQEAVWRVACAMPKSAALNVGIAVRLEGRVDAPALAAAVRCIVDRHALLRSRIALEGEVVWVVACDARPELQTIDLGVFPAQLLAAELERSVCWFLERPFELGSEPLFRCALLRIDDEHATAVLASHHLAVDGWSLDVICRELSAAYTAFAEGRDPHLPTLPATYGDFAEWQRENFELMLAPQLEWWVDRLDRPFAPMRLAGEREPTEDARMERLTRTFSADSVAPFRLRARERGWTLHEGLLAALAAVLYRASGEADVRIGGVLSGRTHPHLDGVVGMFNNILPIITTVNPGATFDSLVQAARRSLLEAHDRQDVPMAHIIREYEVRRGRGTARYIMPVLLTFQQFGASGPTPSVTVSPAGDLARTPESVVTDTNLMFDLIDRGQELIVILDYKRERYTGALIAELLDRYEQLIRRAAAEPDGLIGTLTGEVVSAPSPYLP